MTFFPVRLDRTFGDGSSVGDSRRASLTARKGRSTPRVKSIQSSRVALEGLESRCLLTTFFVATNGSDSAAGGTTTPWQSLQKAVNTAKAGDTVIVRAGTYNAGANMIGLTGGTATNPITIEADPNAAAGSVIVTHSALTGSNADAAAFNIESTGTWIVKGFTVNSDGSMVKAGIRIANSNNSQVIDNTVNHAFTGIFVSNANNSVIQGNTCENSTDQHGIYVSLNTDGTIIRGNDLFGNAWDGLHMNCLVGQANQNALVEDNIIHDNNLSGMDLEGINGATFRNNIIYNNAKHGITIHSQDQGNTPATQGNTFVNNTIVNNGMFGIQMQTADTAETIFNNVIVTSGTTYGAIGVSGTPSGLVSDYNVVVDSLSNTLGVSKLSLASWKSQTGLDAHSVVGTASNLFVNPGSNDFHLKAGAAAINSGTSSLNGKSAAPQDMDGNTRPQGGGVDAGAFEVVSGTSDTTPPTLSAITSTSLLGLTATITWTTNEASTTQVDFGTTTNYGQSSSLNVTLGTLHTVVLTGLNPGTMYHFRVKSQDAAGNLATSSDATFNSGNAPDTTVPTASLVSPIAVTSGASTYNFSVTFADNAGINVSTIGANDVKVTGPNGFSQNATLVSLDNNSNGTPRTATFQITAPGGSWDGADNGTYTFAMQASQVADTSGNFVAAGNLGTLSVNLADTTPPVLSAIASSGVQSGQATVTWTSNEAATTQVEYGTSTSYGQSTTLNSGLVTSHSAVVSGLNPSTTYHYRVKSTDGAGNLTVSPDQTFTTTAVSDTTAPTASLSSPGTITPGWEKYTFTVTYADNAGVNTSTIDSSDVRVTGPNGFSQTATLVSVDNSANGTPRTATYSITEPAGNVWGAADNGTYTVAVLANQVADTNGNFVAAGTVGTFAFNVTDTSPLVASSVVVSGVKTNQATISWNTNKAGTSEVDYGTTTSYGQSSPYDSSLTTTHTATVTGLTPGVTYHYRVKSWDASNNHMVSTDFTFTTPATADVIAPTAVLNPSANVPNGASTYTFSVTYSDNSAISAATINSSGVQVTGPNGYTQTATLLSVSSTTDGSPLTATYQITAPGGTWDSADNGTYTIAMRSGQVTDTAGNPVAAGTLGTFTVNLSPPPVPVTGDVNGDGLVDFNDLTTLLQNYSRTSATLSSGDLTGDGVVDFADLTVLFQNYGAGT